MIFMLILRSMICQTIPSRNNTCGLKVQALLSVLLLVIAIHSAISQTNENEDDARFLTYPHTVGALYAGKYEARISGTRESEFDRLRLDIGATIDILRLGLSEEADSGLASQLTFGADFFTWTRLRSTESFKFPVEAVDYYFGINAAYNSGDDPLLGIVTDTRLRIAHISAHLVDGHPSFTDPLQQYITYSREFVDLMVASSFNGNGELVSYYDTREEPSVMIRPYIGGLWMFHTIPDTLGALAPYAGFDMYWHPEPSAPITLKAGYEARLNTELEPVGEHQFRLGLKLGHPHSNGVLIEGGYYSGRSQYGQTFNLREEYYTVGFSIDY